MIHVPDKTKTWYDPTETEDFNDHYFECLLTLAGQPDLRFLEVGCFEGRATVWFLQHVLTNRTSRIEVIDTFQGSMEYTPEQIDGLYDRFKRNTKQYQDQISIMIGPSQMALHRMYYANEFYDFIYIDASHQASDVLQDTVLAWRLLKTGGVMIWDDYELDRYPEPLLNPRPAIDAFLYIMQGQYTLLSQDYQMRVQKIVETR